MKVFHYIWCAMTIVGIIALFFNPSHIVTLVISALMAYASKPDNEESHEERLR